MRILAVHFKPQKMKQILTGFFSIFIFISLNVSANAQRTQTASGFNSEVSKVESNMKAAFKKGRLTQREYDKLLDEAQDIRQVIDKSMIDDYLTSKEKNSINSKISGLKNKLYKYQHNREIY